MPKLYDEKRNQSHVTRIQKMAVGHGAVQVCELSQLVGEARVILNSNVDTEAGICAALSNAWIIDHAKEGSLWNRIYAGGTLDKTVLRTICAEFVTDSKDASGRKSGLIQAANMTARMRRFGLIPRSRLKSALAPPIPQRVTNVPPSAKRMAADPLLALKIMDAMRSFVSYGRGVGCYVHLSIFDGASAEVGAHSIAMFLGGTSQVPSTWDLPFSDISIYDPNYGEFWFGTRMQRHKTEKDALNQPIRRPAVGSFKAFLMGYLPEAYPDFGGFTMTAFAPRAF